MECKIALQKLYKVDSTQGCVLDMLPMNWLNNLMWCIIYIRNWIILFFCWLNEFIIICMHIDIEMII